MSDWSRRSVLTTVGALSTAALASAETAGESLPDPAIEPNPKSNAAWPSHRGGAGQARDVANEPAIDAAELEADWAVDHHDEIAVADGVVYASIDNGVVALDAADGALVWENPDVAATAPSVDGERVFLTGTEVVALDRSDGRVRWRTDFGTSEDAAWQTVAYGGVYVVINGVLYALDPADGTVRWDVAPGPEDAFVAGTAAANGVVYAATDEAMLAYDPDTGEEVWRSDDDPVRGPAIHANATAVVAAGGPDGDRRRYDAQTGAVLGTASGSSVEVAMGESVAVTRTDDAYRGRSLEDGETEWVLEAATTHGRAAVAGETVYAVVGDDGRRLVALDERDGSERWSVDGGEVPLGPIRAITEDAIYVASDGVLVALRDRSEADDGDDDGSDSGDDSGSEDDSSSEGDGSDRTGDEGSSEDDGSENDGANRTGDEGSSEDDESEDDESNRDDGGEDGSEDDGNDRNDGSEDESKNEETNGEDGDETGSDETDSGTTDADDERSGDDETVDDGTTESDDEGSEAEPESTDDSEDTTDDVRESADDDPDDTTHSGSDGTDGDADDAADESDGMPGFTAGAGIAGGALGLEWLRRRASEADDP
ncbi:outer membrane protein assembly factor BamB family protein [Natronococcus occultus]|uniref:Pyrrolo-quinoline quinone repeat domain-containing protein n=1 Tax=Natronococcus occultus SP4 TaxID=694430 RepID=L0K126_9EURY|nr:PQQ-binding-like beta-propeller repeat protein [Natronococcus occultus]AGB38701.1 hypothetical protein Natoc_2946 [Natronococcus occultus SP4]